MSQVNESLPGEQQQAFLESLREPDANRREAAQVGTCKRDEPTSCGNDSVHSAPASVLPNRNIGDAFSLRAFEAWKFFHELIQGHHH